jgi:GTPase
MPLLSSPCGEDRSAGAATDRRFDEDDLTRIVERITRGHLRTVSRCISWIENAAPSAHSVIESVSRLSGRAMVIGVTGIPGAGKSTLVPELARRLSSGGRKPAILAVDPSSPISGGAILGDRIRDGTSAQSGIFFRSVASRGSVGGLSKTLEDVVTLLDAAGFDAIVIETVGTGQSEIGVTRLAHTTVAVTAPGLGDEIQAMKAGILEVADVVVVNKVDCDPRGAEVTAITLRDALADSQRAHGLAEGANPASVSREGGWLAPVRAVSALRGTGLDDLVRIIMAHRAFLEETGKLDGWRQRRARERFHEALRDALYICFAAKWSTRLSDVEARIADGHVTPLRAAADLARESIAVGAAVPP